MQAMQNCPIGPFPSNFNDAFLKKSQEISLELKKIVGI